MATNEPELAAARRRFTPLVFLLAGTLLIGASLILPGLSDGRSQWTDEQAVELQRASTHLHELTHSFANQSSGETSRELAANLKSAQAEFGRLHGELEAARGRPKRIAAVLQVVGIVLSVGGAVAYFVSSRG